MKVQAIGFPSLDLLRQIPKIQVTEADAGCCGISGSYGFKADKHEISMKIGAKLFKKIKSANVDYVLSECGTCRLQIENGSGKKAIHPISILKTGI